MMFRIDEMVTGEEVTIVLDNGDVPTGFSEDAQRVLLVEGCPGRFLKYLDLDVPNISVLPLVEDSTQEVSPRFGRYRPLADVTIPFWLGFD